MTPRADLIGGAAALGVTLSEADAARLLRLLGELERWNRAYNLTSIDEREEMITHHLLDSLSVHPYLKGERIADVGTGAGFPGLPLAVVNPDRRFTLIDSSNKKVRFVAHAARTLGLTNVEPVHARAEGLEPAEPFDTVVARAFAAIPELLRVVAGLCGPGTRVIAMKGRRPDDEIAAIGADWRLVGVEPVTVPQLGEERHLILIERPGSRSDAASR
ncbi:MAG: 16S rRNA (guanine(527)-N(7))-methyltransferase RsmG [Pseudomonadota bacterium]|jgi:16S rRNA (guanine527-N7)-methyltransferase|nr:MAG: 16S rRNA (guanine(527)-N(7))-methyltransferase RsmG [Pseudomonadota bacterium]